MREPISLRFIFCDECDDPMEVTEVRWSGDESKYSALCEQCYQVATAPLEGCPRCAGDLTDIPSIVDDSVLRRCDGCGFEQYIPEVTR